jgi:NAD(P)-dependent dehydrogenase (short-subunit alcohol dehydrogenase family)
MSKRVCAVVGVGPGNGAAFARRFSDGGFKVALLARRLELTNELAAELPDAKAYPCDVTDTTSIERAFGSIRQELGEVDVLVYNAGSGTWGTVEEITARALQALAG